MKFALLVAALLMSSIVEAHVTRCYAAKAAFIKKTACPGTGLHSPPCRGYVIDHIKPLACGGSDRPSNMQWQTSEEAKAKDKWERKGC